MAANVSDDTLDFETLFKIIRPWLHTDFNDKDLVRVLKRAFVITFTERGIYDAPT